MTTERAHRPGRAAPFRLPPPQKKRTARRSSGFRSDTYSSAPPLPPPAVFSGASPSPPFPRRRRRRRRRSREPRLSSPLFPSLRAPPSRGASDCVVPTRLPSAGATPLRLSTLHADEATAASGSPSADRSPRRPARRPFPPRPRPPPLCPPSARLPSPRPPLPRLRPVPLPPRPRNPRPLLTAGS